MSCSISRMVRPKSVRNAPDQRHQVGTFLGVHAGRGLVQQQQARLRRQARARFSDLMALIRRVRTISA